MPLRCVQMRAECEWPICWSGVRTASCHSNTKSFENCLGRNVDRRLYSFLPDCLDNFQAKFANIVITIIRAGPRNLLLARNNANYLGLTITLHAPLVHYLSRGYRFFGSIFPINFNWISTHGFIVVWKCSHVFHFDSVGDNVFQPKYCSQPTAAAIFSVVVTKKKIKMP